MSDKYKETHDKYLSLIYKKVRDKYLSQINMKNTDWQNVQVCRNGMMIQQYTGNQKWKKPNSRRY